MSHPSLLGLPTEVVNHILDYAIPITRLARHDLLDAEFNRQCAEPRSIPPLLFVNKKLSAQAGDIFYSKAILELAPVKPPKYILNALNRPDTTLDLTSSLDVTFTPIPARSLALVQNVFVYSGQSDAVNAEGYEATLRWLVEKTNVKIVYLSRRLMTRLRKFPVNIDCAIDFVRNHTILDLERTIGIYATHPRSDWERMRTMEMKKAMQGNAPPPCQYFLSRISGPVLLDPRWDARTSDDDQLRQKREEVANFLDSLAGVSPGQVIYTSDGRAPLMGSANHWLYQQCFVLSI